MPDGEFELALLRRAAASTAWPATPDLSVQVLDRIRSDSFGGGAQPLPAGRRPWAVFASLAAVAALVAFIAALALPTSRGAIADFFGIEGSRVDIVPAPAPGTTATALPGNGDTIFGARPVSLGEATEALGFAPLLARGRAPDQVLLLRYAGQPVVVLRYPDGDLWQTRLVAGAVFGKEVPSTGRVEDFLIDGTPARWITGGPHIVFYELPDQTRIDASERVVERNTLIWNDDGVFFRLETDGTRDEAVAVAGSLE